MKPSPTVGVRGFFLPPTDRRAGSAREAAPFSNAVIHGAITLTFIVILLVFLIFLRLAPVSLALARPRPPGPSP